MTKLTEQVLEIVREIPGSTYEEVSVFFPHLPGKRISAILAHLYMTGRIARESVPNPKFGPDNPGQRQKTVFAYSINTDGKPPINPELIKKLPKTAPKIDTDIMIELEELREFKRRAIAKYPTLAVPETTLRARQLVSDYYKQLGDVQHSKDALAGKLDHSPVVQIAIKAFEE